MGEALKRESLNQQNLSEEMRERLSKVKPDDKMANEFYEFCREKLPFDKSYKESVLFVSLFYYFL